jgi:tRNA 2-thiouridine synthesizing protein B
MALILVKYGVHHPIEKTKLECAQDADQVVLIQDGVFWALNDDITQVKGKVSAIKDDFLARGYPETASRVPLTSYAEFVEIVEQEPKTIG